MFWWTDLDYIQITPSQTTLQLWRGGMIVQTSLPTSDDLPNNQIRHIYEKQGVEVRYLQFNYECFGNGYDNTRKCGTFYV
jgi:hypothetical protein